MLERAAAVADSLPFLLPSPPLPSPLPFLFFSLHDVCRRLFHLANPPVPLHCHPISAPRESTLPPPLPPVHAFPRLFRDKGRQSGGEINTRRAGNEAGGEGRGQLSNFRWRIIFSDLQQPLSLPFLFSFWIFDERFCHDLRGFRCCLVLSNSSPRGFYEWASSIFIKFLNSSILFQKKNFFLNFFLIL